jgi:hypothetical protein
VERKKKKCNLKQKKFIDILDDSLYIKTLFLWDGTNIEIEKLRFILIEKTEEGITISSESHEDENPSYLVTLLVKMCGTGMGFASLTHTETS